MGWMEIPFPTRTGWRGASRRSKGEPGRGCSWMRESMKTKVIWTKYKFFETEHSGARRSMRNKNFYSVILKKSRNLQEQRCLESKLVVRDIKTVF